MAIGQIVWSGRLAPPAAVTLKGIGKVFGTLPALAGVDLEVGRGEIVFVRGPNGAGKSTLLRILATLTTPTRGRGRLLGHDLLREREAIRRTTEYLGHRTGFYNDLSARENLRFAARLRGADAGRTAALLDLVGLAGFGEAQVGGFSQGMRRRLAIARLLLKRSQLWLLDEAYADLDAGGRDLLDEALLAAARQGTTIFVVSHDGERSRLRGREVVLEQGRVVE